MHHKIIKALIGALASLALAVGVNVTIDTHPQTAQIAEAADPYIWVCNESSSADNIVATGGNGAKTSINQGNCRSINDRNGDARVDVDPSGGEADVDSYQIFTDCYPYNCSRIYGPCHTGENGASNPDSSRVRTSHYITRIYTCNFWP